MDKTNSEISTKKSKAEIEEKFKIAIQTFFLQFKHGCFRKNCYNPHCKRTKIRKFENDKEILKEAMKMARESNFSLNFCTDTKKFLVTSEKKYIEDFIFEFNEINVDPNDYFDLDRLPPMNFNFKKLSKEFDRVDLIEFLETTNAFLNSILTNFPNSDFDIKENLPYKTFVRWNFYIFYLSRKLLVMISLHQNFNYSEATHHSLNSFFQAIIKIENNFRHFLNFYKDGKLIAKNPTDKLSLQEHEILKLQKQYSSNNRNNSYSSKIDFENSSNLTEHVNTLISNQSVDKNDDSMLKKGNLHYKMDEETQNLFNHSKQDIMEVENLNKNQSLVGVFVENKYQKELEERKNFRDKLSNLDYNLTENEKFKLFVQNSNYLEMQDLSQGIFDPYYLFSSYLNYMPFIDMVAHKEKFLGIIHNYQNFLLLIIMIGSDEESEVNFTNIIFNFLPIFEIFYKINEILQIVDNSEFYNEYINKNVEINFQIECKNYLKYLKSEDKSKFCWLRFFFIFNAKSKSEILYEFNYKTQREEFLNHLSNLSNPFLFNQNIGNAYIIIEIKRNNMIEDSLNFLVNSQNNFKKQLKVKFIGEQGIDEGGVKKEYFLLLVRQIFNPEYGMFTYSEKTRFFWFNPNSFEAKIKFELIGIIFGLAFFNNVILDIKFPLVVYKKLLNIKPSLQDIKEIDEEMYNTFNFLINTKETNLKEIIGTNFTVTVENFGEKKVIPIKPDGENIFIDENNRFEYVELYLDWYFNKSIEEFFAPFKKGFYRVTDDKLLHILKSEELELIICGSQELDFVELEKAARYQDGFEESSETIKLFWQVVHSLNQEEKKKFLLFLTGCDRAPLDGLGSLIITISRFGPDSDKLPCAHTCFNHLLLPDYQNLEKLRNRLLIAINHSEGFGLL